MKNKKSRNTILGILAIGLLIIIYLSIYNQPFVIVPFVTFPFAPDGCVYVDYAKAKYDWSNWEDIPISDGYGDCFYVDGVKESGSNAGEMYHVGCCRDCPEGKIKITTPNKDSNSGFVYSCLESECSEGETKDMVCGDNSKVITHICENSFWSIIPDVKCCSTEGKVQFCSNNPSVVNYRCENSDWVKINDCGGIVVDNWYDKIIKYFNSIFETIKGWFLR